jgi:hypothetical protein
MIIKSYINTYECQHYHSDTAYEVRETEHVPPIVVGWVFILIKWI